MGEEASRGVDGHAYPARMGGLSTGSATWDVVLEIGIALALVVTIVLLIRNYRGR
jgi:low affinity Fe/Cu permease